MEASRQSSPPKVAERRLRESLEVRLLDDRRRGLTGTVGSLGPSRKRRPMRVRRRPRAAVRHAVHDEDGEGGGEDTDACAQAKERVAAQTTRRAATPMAQLRGDQTASPPTKVRTERPPPEGGEDGPGVADYRHRRRRRPTQAITGTCFLAGVSPR